MSKKEQKRKSDTRQKAKKLRVKKQTVKDLEPEEPSRLQGGAVNAFFRVTDKVDIK